MRWTWGAWVAVLMSASGCDGIDFSQFQHDARSRVIPESPGANCEHGGQALQTGLDLNDNGQLEDGEVESTKYVCQSAPPAVLTRTRPEPEGASCEHGGTAVQTGLDQDVDGQLDDGEVTATEYVCATAVPAVLVRTRQVPPGEQCPKGGQVSHAGQDVNGNGLLEDGEITREVYGCMQPAPVLTRTRLLGNYSPFCSFGGSALDAGQDVDEDGTLDESEVQATAYLCGVDTSLVVSRQSVEPAGPRCTVAGTKVEVGSDWNENGQHDDGETTTVTYVCEPSRTYEGSYEVRRAADLAALQGISRIHGDLYIQGEELTEVVLQGLRVVDGSLYIREVSNLTRVDLDGLRFVGKELAISYGPKLDTLTIGEATGERLWVGTDLSIYRTALTHLGGLMGALPHEDVVVSDNDALESLGALYYVNRLTGGLTIRNNDVLQDISLPSLEWTGGFVEIINNDALESLSGLGNLWEPVSGLRIVGNDALLSLEGLSRMRSTASLQVEGNARLRSTVGLINLHTAGGIGISDNPELEVAGDMPLLQSTDSISFSRNAKLTSVANLPSLQSVDTVLAFSSNPQLTNLAGLANVLHLKSLQVEDNDALTSLASLQQLHDVADLAVRDNARLAALDLPGLEEVTRTLDVHRNAALPTCAATAFAASFFTGSPDRVSIRDNDDTGTCGP